MPSKNIVDFANKVKSYALGIKDQQVLGAWNLLPIMVASQSINNVSFTVNSDKSITTHRTATSSSSSILYLANNDHVFTLPKGKYYLSDGKPENSEAWVFVSLVNGTTIVAQNIATTENGEAEFDTSPYTYDKMYIGVRISKDQTEDVTFKSMISTQPNQPYVPNVMTNRELTDRVIPIATDVKTDFNTWLADIDNQVSAQQSTLYRLGKLVVFTARLNVPLNHAFNASNVSMPSFLPVPMLSTYGFFQSAGIEANSMLTTGGRMYLIIPSKSSGNAFADILYVYFTS